VTKICNAEGSKKYQDIILKNFMKVTEHPEDSGLIYYSDDDLTPEKIVTIFSESHKIKDYAPSSCKYCKVPL